MLSRLPEPVAKPGAPNSRESMPHARYTNRESALANGGLHARRVLPPCGGHEGVTMELDQATLEFSPRAAGVKPAARYLPRRSRLARSAATSSRNTR